MKSSKKTISPTKKLIQLMKNGVGADKIGMEMIRWQLSKMNIKKEDVKDVAF